jgi:hypothetical protein
MFTDQQSSEYKAYESNTLQRITTINKPVFECKNPTPWIDVFSTISEKVQVGHMPKTTQGQIFLLAQRWGKAIDMRKDMFPEVKYEATGFTAADTLENALTGAQVSKALALVVATHIDGNAISRQIIEAKGKIYKPGYVFDYATRDVILLEIALQEFTRLPIYPYNLSNLPPSATTRFSLN